MKKILLLLTVLITVSSFSQSNLWRKIDKNDATSLEKLPRDSHPLKYELFSLNFNELKTVLSAAPKRFSGITSNVIVSFPNADGVLENFRIYEASVLAPELAARHQEIQSYVGQGIGKNTSSIRFSTTIFGLHTMTFNTGKGVSFIDPYSKDLNHYMVYNKSDLTTTRSFQCEFVNDTDVNTDVLDTDVALRAENSLFKTYRLAMACTIEYAAYHVNAAGLNSGSLAQKKGAVLNAMAVTMVRVDGVYELEMALTMVLVPNNEDIIFITSDSFSNDTATSLINESQTKIDELIGSANYDIGHTVSTGGGGLAQRNSPCTGSKARGITGSPAPVGDPYDIDYVAHEMGHQWGGDHTFNNSCGGNISTTSSYEPGSGSTIMAYAGICPPNVQNNSDSYLHSRSIIQMINHVNGTGNCGVIIPNGNTAPVIAPLQNYAIPKSTPFVLDVVATDVDGDALTYCWEQYDRQVTTQPPVATSTTGPMYRSLNPTSSSKRYFPSLATVQSGSLSSTWEVTPTVGRTMTFSVLVRDNELVNGGQTKRETSNITVDGTAGPFIVTSQTTQVGWVPGANETITWDVAGTSAAPISTSTVTIKLSTDGGLTFPHILASNTPNDGSQSIVVPNLPASQTCRVMVEADGNVYFAVNSTAFLLGYEVATTCTTYSYTGGAFTIPDGSSSFTVKTVSIPTAGNISDVNVTINATHPNLQNLFISMARPGGSLLNLYNQQCSGNANMNVTFDQQGATFTCASPTSGTFLPPTGADMSVLNGTNVAAGNWSFGFKDLVAGNVGTINSIDVEVCRNTVTLANSTFAFQDLAIFPNPTNGNFNVQFTTSSSEKVIINVVDMSGRRIFEKTYSDTGLFNQNIQLEQAQSGVYLVSITDGDKKIVKKIVVQ